MHDFIYHLQIKALKNRRFALIENGSWAPIAAKVMKEMLAELKNTEIVEPTMTIRGKMHEADIAALTQLADALLG
jgi:flavorubredoxin